MTEWICPNCLGGFPTDGLKDDVACPWCEFMLGEVADVQSRANSPWHSTHPWTPAYKGDDDREPGLIGSTDDTPANENK